MSRARPATDKPPQAALNVLALTVLLDLMGFGMILPLLPFYAEDFGASAFQVGLLFASYSLAQFLFSPLWGRFSDRWGRRPILLASIAGGFFAYLLFAAASSLTLLFVARLVAGAAAANFSVAQAYAADVTNPTQRAAAMGRLGAAFGLGFIFGPALGGILGQWGAATVPLAAAVLCALNFALAFRLLPESLPSQDRRRYETGSWFRLEVLRRLESRKTLPLLLVLYAVVIFSFSAMESTLALFCEERLQFGSRETSWLFVLVGVIMVGVHGFMIRPLTRRFGEGRLLATGIGIMALGLLILPSVYSLLPLLPAAILLAAGSGLHHPSSSSLMSRLAPVDAQGGVLGLARSAGALARVIGPVWGGWSFHHLGVAWPFLSAGGVMIAATLLALWLLPRLNFHT